MRSHHIHKLGLKIASTLLASSTLVALARAEVPEPVPGPEGIAERVTIVDGRDAGDLVVDARGQGEDRVQLSIRNESGRRLNVIIPPGLVAAALHGQGPGALQNMGLSGPTERPGAFGRFRGDGEVAVGLRSVPVAGPRRDEGVIVPAGQVVTFSVPAVCLNFGLRAPTPHDAFRLVDVDEVATDRRVGLALRSLETIGTSHGVAQAVIWHVANGLSFEELATQSARRMNRHEVALAARFVGALDSHDLDALPDNRIVARVMGEGRLASDARRLNEQLEGQHLLGFTIRVATGRVIPTPTTPALLVTVALTTDREGQIRRRVSLSHATVPGEWRRLGSTPLEDETPLADLDGPTLAEAVDRAIASGFVTLKPVKRNPGSTIFRIDNRLPFTLAHVAIRAGNPSETSSMLFPGVGVGPGRSAPVSIPAAKGAVVRVELNGL